MAWADAADVVTIVTVADPAAPVTLNYTVAQTAVTFGPPDTDAVFTGDWDGAGYTWSRTGRVIDYTRPISDATGRNYIAATLGAIERLTYSVPDQLLITSYHVGDVRVTDPATGRLYAHLACAIDAETPVRVSPTGGVLTAACGLRDQLVFGAWDLRPAAPRLASYQNRFTDLLTAAGHTYGAVDVWPSHA